jgi:hypothetical protein
MIWQQLWWTFLQSACQLHAPSKRETSVALCCDKTAHFSGLLLFPAQGATVMIMLFNQLLDMAHLSGGQIIFAKEKCSLAGM